MVLDQSVLFHIIHDYFSDTGVIHYQAKPLSKPIWVILIGPLGTNVNKSLIIIQNVSFTKMHLKISFAKWRPFRPDGDEFKRVHRRWTVSKWPSTAKSVSSMPWRHHVLWRKSTPPPPPPPPPKKKKKNFNSPFRKRLHCTTFAQLRFAQV